jgi:hypothetical protein
MVAHCLDEHDPRLRLARVIVSKSTGAWALEVIVDVPSGVAAGPGLHDLRELIMSSLQRYAGLMLSQVDVTVGSLLPDVDGNPSA